MGKAKRRHAHGSPEARITRDGRFAPLIDDRATGRAIEIAWLEDGRVATRRTVAEADMGAALDLNAASAAAHPKGSLIGHTQRHRTPYASIPKPLYELWLTELGPPNVNTKAWLKRLRDHPRLLTSGYVS